MSTVFTKETKLQRVTHLCFDNYFKKELSEKEMAHETLKLQIATLKEVQEEEIATLKKEKEVQEEEIATLLIIIYLIMLIFFHHAAY